MRGLKHFDVFMLLYIYGCERWVAKRIVCLRFGSMVDLVFMEYDEILYKQSLNLRIVYFCGTRYCWLVGTCDSYKYDLNYIWVKNIVFGKHHMRNVAVVPY